MRSISKQDAKYDSLLLFHSLIVRFALPCSSCGQFARRGAMDFKFLEENPDFHIFIAQSFLLEAAGRAL